MVQYICIHTYMYMYIYVCMIICIFFSKGEEKHALFRKFLVAWYNRNSEYIFVQRLSQNEA